MNKIMSSPRGPFDKKDLSSGNFRNKINQMKSNGFNMDKHKPGEFNNRRGSSVQLNDNQYSNNN